MPFKSNEVNKAFILIALVGVVGASILGAVFSHDNAAIIFGFSAVITGQLLTMLQQDRNAHEASSAVKEVAVKAEEVKEALSRTVTDNGERLDRISNVGKATLTLVNNAMAMQLKVNMLLARELAAAKKDDSYVAAAEEAERLYVDHMAKQAKVDKGA